jgi:N-acetylglutamate synthase-like GNAT family acetyltransferase
VIDRANYVIRKATQADLDEIKALADAHKQELGFVLRPILARSIEQGELIVTENSSGLVGFVQYHHRRDEQTTLHNIVIKPEYRDYGIGRQLIQALENEARSNNKRLISLKCPEGLPANNFYRQVGYQQVRIETGKSRRLLIWRKEI